LFLQQTRFLSFWDFEVNLFIRQYSDSGGGEVSVSAGKNRDRLLKIPVNSRGDSIMVMFMGTGRSAGAATWRSELRIPTQRAPGEMKKIQGNMKRVRKMCH